MKELNRENMGKLIKNLGDVYDLIDTGKLKVAKEIVKEQVLGINLSETVRSWFADAARNSTKAGYKEELAKCIEGLKEVLAESNKEVEVDKARLEELAGEIRKNVSVVLTTNFNTGKYLNEALQLFKNAGKPARDWLEWAEIECGVKKAQAYNLVRIYTQFGDKEEFQNVSTRVLNIMVHLDKAVYDQAENELVALAKKGQLTTKALNTVLDKFKPAPKTSLSEKLQAATETDITGDAIEKSLISGPTKNTGTDVSEQPENSSDSEIERLKSLNTSLRETIIKLTDQVAKLSKSLKEKPATALPYLPQFDSSEPHIVLGISPVSGKDEINKQYRAMALIFNGSSCPDGALKLKAAKEALLASAEK